MGGSRIADIYWNQLSVHGSPAARTAAAAPELLDLRELAAPRCLRGLALVGGAFLVGYLVLRTLRSFVASLLATLIFVGLAAHVGSPPLGHD